jgi:CRISPR-associated protein Cas5d
MFGEGKGHYDEIEEVTYGLMFHSFGYPDETGEDKLITRFWRPVMKKGVIEFSRTDDPSNIIKEVRPMNAKRFGDGTNLKNVVTEYNELILQISTEGGGL